MARDVNADNPAQQKKVLARRNDMTNHQSDQFRGRLNERLLAAETEGPCFQESPLTEQQNGKGSRISATYPSLDYLSALYTLEYV